jgi:hypothetical protein
MSLTAFKNKSVIQYGSKRSGIAPGGIWIPQGPFGHATSILKKAVNTYGPVGFSINGGHRNIGGVGTEMKMSKSGTPFRGIHAIGWGGTFGKYPRSHAVFNSQIVDTMGTQYLYIKPSTLSTFGMLRKRYKWAYYGQYPNYWVQPNYGHTTQSDTKSQGKYLHDLTVANICVEDINNVDKYVGFIRNGGGTTCHTTPALFKYNDVSRNSLYTKRLYQPLDASEQILRVQRRCADPRGRQKPFPYATNGNSCNPSINVNYVSPPKWYTTDTPSNNAQIN